VTYGHASEPSVSVPAGYRGVDLFFIISGCVILMTLDRTREAGHFVVSRFSRLFPTYWAAMLTSYAVVTLTGLPGKQVSATDLLLNVTMMPELLQAGGRRVLDAGGGAVLLRGHARAVCRAAAAPPARGGRLGADTGDPAGRVEQSGFGGVGHEAAPAGRVAGVWPGSSMVPPPAGRAEAAGRPRGRSEAQ
jgi:hypothetical protein